MEINRYPDGRIYRKKEDEEVVLKNAPKKKKHKYGAVKTTVGDLTFPTKKEARHYTILMQMKRAGLIKSFEMQTTYEIFPGYRNTKGEKVQAITYISDFDITTLDGEVYVCDSKGMETAVFRIKKKLFGYKYGKDIVLFKEDSDIHKLIIGGDDNG